MLKKIKMLFPVFYILPINKHKYIYNLLLYMHYSSGLLRQVFTIEFNNLKHVCKFYYKGDLTKNQVLHLKEYDFTMENNDIYIHSLNQQDKWKNNLYYQDAYNSNNLFYNYLKKKYRV